ncbi:MAG: hypothetical protein ACERKD_06125 [Prolixibacteraceae bacterium]
MKKVISIFALVMIVFVNVVSAKSIVKDTESFTISKNDLSTADNAINNTWTIEYTDAKKAIEVIKIETKKGEEYIVRNEFFEVRYVNTDNGFGVRKIKNNQSEVNPLITENVINKDQMQNQSMLSSSKLDEEKSLSYIASFVPALLNENYKHILN